MSTSPPLRTTPKRQSKLASWTFGLSMGAMVLLFVGILTLLFGRVSGEEFSPLDFKRRSFHYYEIPGVGLQVWPIRHFDSTGSVESDLIQQKLVPSAANDADRWDLVRGFRGSSVVAEGDALFLCRFFDQHTTGKHTWLDWTAKHPEMAKTFWPLVAELAQAELYFFIPDLFHLAHSADDPKNFEKALRALVAEKYYQFGLAQQKVGKHKEAVELLTAAIRHSPDKPSAWQAALDTSRKELPQAEAN